MPLRVLAAIVLATPIMLAGSRARAAEPPFAPPPSPTIPASPAAPVARPAAEAPDAAPSDPGKPAIVQPTAEAPTAVQPAPDSPALAPRNSEPARFTRGEAVGWSLVSGAFSLGSLGVNELPSPAIGRVHGYYDYGTSAAASVPLIPISPKTGISIESVQLASIGTAILLRHAAGIGTEWRPYWVAAEAFSLHVGIYATYATYREARTQGRSEAWNDDWKPWTLDTLVAAPFRPKNYDHPIVIAPLAVEGALLGLVGAANLATGKHAASAGAFGRDLAIGTALALDAGVTEEALFRGFIYEELKLSLGRWPARAIDSTLFTLAHVPGELGAHDRPATIAVGLATRAAFSLIAEAAYDEGGLPESVAFHAAWDTLAFAMAAVVGVNPLGTQIAMPRGLSATSTTPREVVVPIVAGSF